MILPPLLNKLVMGGGGGAGDTNNAINGVRRSRRSYYIN
jgi:hypothetical protein